MASPPAPDAGLRGLVERTYPRGRYLYEAGEPADRLFIVQQGEVRLSRITKDGHRLITETLRAGQICGAEALSPGAVYGMDAETARPTTVTAVSHHALHELALAQPELLIRLLARLEERLVQAEERLVEVSTSRLPARVAAALLREMAGCACPTLALTHQEIADMVGTYRETTSRLLNDLRRQGALRLTHGRVEVLDAELLAAVRDESV